MKQLITAALMALCCLAAAQTTHPFNYSIDVRGNALIRGGLSVGDSSMADSSAIAEFSSHTKGVLPVRLSTAQMLSINNPADGLTVFNSDSGKYYFYFDSTWAQMGAGATGATGSADAWKLSGNSGITTANFIGTTDTGVVKIKSGADTSFTIQVGKALGGLKGAMLMSNDNSGMGVVDATPFGGKHSTYIIGYPFANRSIMVDSNETTINNDTATYRFKSNGLQIGNYTISDNGGSTGQVLTLDGSNIATWQTPGGGGGSSTTWGDTITGSPDHANQIMYFNNNGQLWSDNDFTLHRNGSYGRLLYITATNEHFSSFGVDSNNASMYTSAGSATAAISVFTAPSSFPSVNIQASGGGNIFLNFTNGSSSGDSLLAVNGSGALIRKPMFNEADSATIYSTTPADFNLWYCTDCTGNGITGRVVAYIASAWRRLNFE